jgi:hypothetical protein
LLAEVDRVRRRIRDDRPGRKAIPPIFCTEKDSAWADPVADRISSDAVPFALGAASRIAPESLITALETGPELLSAIDCTRGDEASPVISSPDPCEGE